MPDILILTPTQLGDQLRALRTAQGLTQAEVGARLGVTAMRISAIEDNPAPVGFANVLKLLHVLGARIILDSNNAGAGGASRDATPGGQW